MPQLTFSERKLNTKRHVDLVLALLLMAVLAPLALLIALAVKASSRGPILYRHRRIGRDGHIFNCLKFRTMHRLADSQLASLLRSDAGSAGEWGQTQKLRRDPRITPVGRLLRVTSLDELPQLINIVRGEMSLVGPRPVTAHELERYGADAVWYLSVRPGLTGVWQISGRSLLSFEARVRIDTDYVRNWSLGQDLRVLARTPWVVLRRHGAC